MKNCREPKITKKQPGNKPAQKQEKKMQKDTRDTIHKIKEGIKPMRLQLDAWLEELENSPEYRDRENEQSWRITDTAVELDKAFTALRRARAQIRHIENANKEQDDMKALLERVRAYNKVTRRKIEE
jgi:hypothetical protein